MKQIITFLIILVSLNVVAQEVISDSNNGMDFPIVTTEAATTVFYDKNEDSLVPVAVNLFTDDIERVTGKRPQQLTKINKEKNIIIIGTLEKCSFFKELEKNKKIDFSALRGEWDGYMIQVVKSPFKGVDSALIIAGSNKRGAAYGALELTKQMGVSPWYWWADVPVKKKEQIFIKSDVNINDAPKVKYRGIFINDEAPALSGWVEENYGKFNHEFYTKVFELLLRNKANYLWPAMWGRAFNDDDKLNPVLADKWGIVMGTSHHEPMLRAQAEWKRYGSGAWDYTKNEAVLKDFWRKGIKNMGSHESLVTIGMRGDGDEPMTEGTATALLERIVKDQRDIIEEVTGKSAEETPQVWALYKEVQDYYDKGMRVPDDVTLLLCDDNWGNLRKLPARNEKERKGGYGIYYHFDYVGGPRNYKWINTNNIARVWEQMHLAWEYNVKQIWIVNVGDIKPIEFPISFFLDYAWNPEKWTPDNLRDYYTQWARGQFGDTYAKEIGIILREYGQLASRRKPELVDKNTYSLENYDEAFRVVNEYKQLLEKAEKIENQLPEDYKDAYYQLVLHPIQANENLHRMYVAVALNEKYAAQNNSKANAYADLVKELFIKDSLISKQYNKELSGGKWNHFMDQTHIGYTSWFDPKNNIMPSVSYVSDDSPIKPFIEITETIESSKEQAVMDTKTVFYEENGYVSINAENYSKANNTNGIEWKIIPDIGRTTSGVTPFPVTAPVQDPYSNGPSLEYTFYSYEDESVNIHTYFSPTLNFHNTESGLRYAVSVDDSQPVILSINAEKGERAWASWVANNIIIKETAFKELTSGKHTLKIWMVDPGIILQKIILDFGGMKKSYLGPPETR
ncbi:glycosyl hydrolase 115 family protein [Flavobacterium alkalisoli]|uniref:glycosyl hydrolase 115 family protein n=1 Tax=Flavobacterium alkalisoli TaxID=2602769 RepID=UPI003A91E56C